MNSRTMIRAALVVALLCAAAAGCKKEAAEKAAVPPAATGGNDLATRLNAMDPQAQIDTMRTLVKMDSTDAQMHFYAGNAYYSFASGLEASAPNRSAYLDSAATCYHRAVAIDSTMSKAWVNLGLAYEDDNKPADAQKALETAIAVNPKDVLAYCHLGYLYHANGNLSKAMDEYKQALAIDPNSAQAHYNLGLAFAESKIFGEAVREWELVIKADPNSDLGKTASENVKIIKQYSTNQK
ncbi:MAG TPA: tetratricopeptide repeat protein [Candidatus Krumholzibacteria bacterium]|nr:tetratricopeptide repeat protein [Candidatus Krumholzibacteria bacterium]